MKCLLYAVALCIAVNLSIAEEEEHWALKLRTLARNPDAEPSANDTILRNILQDVNVVNPEPTETTSFQLKNRYPYNPLNLTRIIKTDETLEKWLTKRMASFQKKYGPDAFWNKVKALENSTGNEQTFTSAVDLALADVTKVIKEYQHSLKESCGNLNTSLTGKLTAPNEQKLQELKSLSSKLTECLERQEEVLDHHYKNEDGLKMAVSDVAISTLVHNATLISKRFTDCAAVIVAMTVLHRNELCFDELRGETVETEIYLDKMRKITNRLGSAINNLSDEQLIEKYADIYAEYVEVLKEPEAHKVLRGRIPHNYVRGFDIESQTSCAEDLIKSATQAAIELDMKHIADSCITTMKELAPHFYGANNNN